jgi:hypothetical protein
MDLGRGSGVYRPRPPLLTHSSSVGSAARAAALPAPHPIKSGQTIEIVEP